MDEVFRRGTGEDLRDEVSRYVDDAIEENRVGILQQLTRSVFILEGVNRPTEVLQLACTTSAGSAFHVTPLSIAAQIAPEIDPAEDPFRRRCGTCVNIGLRPVVS